MKTKKTQLLQQRKVIDKKLLPWTGLRFIAAPPSGWLKAVRGALGLSAARLAQRMNINQASLTRLEGREVQGTATLESLDKAARAMNCRLIYAIVPDNEYASLEDILRERALKAARHIVEPVSHTMKLERQGVELQDMENHVQALAETLRTTLDPRLWEDEAKLLKKGHRV